MLGFVRFILALLVMVSHFPVNKLPLNVGIIAVACFYFISGFLMRQSFERFAANSPNPSRAFYIDRVIKLFPQYVIVCWLSFMAIQYFGPPHLVPFLDQRATLLKVTLNTLLLPANYVFPPFVIPAMLPHPIIPPAWSLATEFHFYLLLPLLFMGRKYLWVTVLAGSALIQWASFWFNLPNFNTATFAYRYIFGVLVLFLYGYAFVGRDSKERYIALMVWLGYVIHLMLLIFPTGFPRNTVVLELVLGGVIALPLAACVMRVQWRWSFLKSVDRILGDLAYPIFISHYLAFYLVENFFYLTFDHPRRFFLASLLVCLIVSLCLSRMQKLLDTFRIARRGFASLSEKGLRESGKRLANSKARH